MIKIPPGDINGHIPNYKQEILQAEIKMNGLVTKNKFYILIIPILLY
jgi:hypothetical protein